ncbi:hypothetical protein BDK51DRAFT_49500 [Blyttiomyces helicus]|uniref:Uncharacterized protein n=1 Tax=Blyttiomyces helicus TaxID=388810 RepID=A0A4P9VZB2_9FUNG|nr:hypothetical protein BDK51DRAFT_49500 [Blyttiomyces helicus]|eukprot:RKO83698.1 hypothetical protein BDK51DRAFT_49500 [Blyttiomyces helicus]
MGSCGLGTKAVKSVVVPAHRKCWFVYGRGSNTLVLSWGCHSCESSLSPVKHLLHPPAYVGRVDETRVTVGLLEDRKLLRQRLEQVLNIPTKTERIMAVYVATADAVERFHDINQLTTDDHLYIFTTSMLRRHDRFFKKYNDTIKSPALSISVSHGSGGSGIPGSEVQLAEAKARQAAAEAKALEDGKARQEEAKSRQEEAKATQEEAKATQEEAKTRRQTEKYTAMREFMRSSCLLSSGAILSRRIPQPIDLPPPARWRLLRRRQSTSLPVCLAPSPASSTTRAGKQPPPVENTGQMPPSGNPSDAKLAKVDLLMGRERHAVERRCDL